MARLRDLPWGDMLMIWLCVSLGGIVGWIFRAIFNLLQPVWTDDGRNTLGKWMYNWFDTTHVVVIVTVTLISMHLVFYRRRT